MPFVSNKPVLFGQSIPAGQTKAPFSIQPSIINKPDVFFSSSTRTPQEAASAIVKVFEALSRSKKSPSGFAVSGNRFSETYTNGQKTYELIAEGRDIRINRITATGTETVAYSNGLLQYTNPSGITTTLEGIDDLVKALQNAASHARQAYQYALTDFVEAI